MSLVEEFGKSVLNYFLMNYNKNTVFKFSIDDYTFSSCAKNAGINETQLVKSLQMCGTYFTNPNEAIAIAAYQVKIAGDVKSVTASGTNGYYKKIRDNYPQYANCGSDMEIMNCYFRDYQIELWNTVKTLFSSYDRILDMPNDHPGPGRYVQYPVKSHELSNTELLKWADTFIRQKLLPKQVQLTYSKFCEIFFHCFERESYKRTIWNFYCIWDGRSYNEIISRAYKVTGHQSKKNKLEILLEMNETEITFCEKDNGKNILSTKIISSLIYSATNIIYFKPFCESGLYEPSKEPVELGSEIVLLTENKLQLEEGLIKQVTQKIDRLNITAYLCKVTNNICSILNLKIQSTVPPVRFVGGLRKRNGHYYSFCLPVIEFTEPQGKAYINAKEIPIKNNRIYLEDWKEFLESKNGTYVLKLPDYIPLEFQIDEPEGKNDNVPEIIGWSFMLPIVVPAKINDKKIISGFYANFKFKKIIGLQKKISRERLFVQQKHRYENRFINQNVKRGHV
jgi:hypothetical protein